MKNYKNRTLAILFATFLAAVAAPAHAALILTLNAGNSNVVTIADNGVGDLDNDVGQVMWTGVVGSFFGNLHLNLTIGTSNAPGTPTGAYLDLFSIDVTSRRGGTLLISLTDSGFLQPSGPGMLASYSASGFTAGLVDFNSLINNTSIGTLGPYHGVFNGSGNAIVDTSGGFSMTQTARISHAGAGTTTFNASTSVTNIPEPATLGLLGMGLIGLALARRRKS